MSSLVCSVTDRQIDRHDSVTQCNKVNGQVADNVVIYLIEKLQTFFWHVTGSQRVLFHTVEWQVLISCGVTVSAVSWNFIDWQLSWLQLIQTVIWMPVADRCSIIRLHCDWSTFLKPRSASFVSSPEWNSTTSMYTDTNHFSSSLCYSIFHVSRCRPVIFIFSFDLTWSFHDLSSVYLCHFISILSIYHIASCHFNMQYYWMNAENVAIESVESPRWLCIWLSPLLNRVPADNSEFSLQQD